MNERLRVSGEAMRDHAMNRGRHNAEGGNNHRREKENCVKIQMTKIQKNVLKTCVSKQPTKIRRSNLNRNEFLWRGVR